MVDDDRRRVTGRIVQDLPGDIAGLTVEGDQGRAFATDRNDDTIAAGQTATFSVTKSGTPVVHVQWQVSKDGGRTFTNVPLAVFSTLTLRKVKVAQSGYMYRATLTNAFDQIATPAATLTVN